MSARGRMTMRAEVERDTAAGKDSWGQPLAPAFQPLATVPCFVWSRSRREVADGDKTALVEDLRAIFPLDADVRARDEIARVTDRRGVEILAGRLRVDSVQRKHDHLEAMLERIS